MKQPAIKLDGGFLILLPHTNLYYEFTKDGDISLLIGMEQKLFLPVGNWLLCSLK